MIQVLFAASEATPFVQTGGLAEVAGSLPQALARAGCDVRLILPAYRARAACSPPAEVAGALAVPGFATPAVLRRLRLAPLFEVWFVDAPAYFDRAGGPYAGPDGIDWPDNAERFAFFSHAVATLATQGLEDGWRPQVVHANDWQTGLVPLLLHPLPAAPASVFTIHNLAYRGLYAAAEFAQLRLPSSLWHPEGLEFHGQVALIKGGLAYADRITTVSPTYAREIQTAAHGWGLDGLLRSRADVLAGILNGIDCETWDPAHDPALPAGYDAARLAARVHNRRALQAEFGLPMDAGDSAAPMLVGCVTRFAAQKGIDLLLDALPGLLQHPLQFLFLGNGERALESAVQALAAAHPTRIACRIGFDVALSHRMFGGLDAFAMPSRFEPCGLSQLFSQRYGTVPVVRHTGGLADSVEDEARGPGATGFVFGEESSLATGHALWRALQVFRHDRLRWQQLQHNGMARDFSWARSAEEYAALYRGLLRETS
jgi:starch synthase